MMLLPLPVVCTSCLSAEAMVRVRLVAELKRSSLVEVHCCACGYSWQTEQAVEHLPRLRDVGCPLVSCAHPGVDGRCLEDS